MDFLGIGTSEIVVVLAVALIAFGPKRLPEIARHISKAMKMFREASNELQRQLEMSDWDDHKTSKTTKTTSYSSPYTSPSSTTKTSPEGISGSDSSSSTTQSVEGSSNASLPTPYGESNYYGNGGNPSSSESASGNTQSQSPVAKPIDDPNKVEDAQRYAREMTD